MSETNPTPSGASAEPPTWQPAPQPTPAAAAAPAAPTTTAAPRQPFKSRVVKLWHALIVAVACLIVGLGVGGVFGGLVGFVVGHHDRGTVRQFNPPGLGNSNGQFNGPGSTNRLPQGAPQRPGSSSGSGGSTTPSAPASPQSSAPTS
ncbi:hypothetical protein [Nocardioides sp. Kera G14]|uniref:hypothetical protein n=1 Tax=Nocardioides sp. Kera G14 TaxID=2884264 RepID=UPI001D11A4A5|nr:hypothetical protein [Nocardioides sp. Kera G14]UDY23064.1 hypothetical protein LH076_13475 [Nocardioides sp. Kera G14]